MPPQWKTLLTDGIGITNPCFAADISDFMSGKFWHGVTFSLHSSSTRLFLKVEMEWLNSSEDILLFLSTLLHAFKIIYFFFLANYLFSEFSLYVNSSEEILLFLSTLLHAFKIIYFFPCKLSVFRVFFICSI